MAYRAFLLAGVRCRVALHVGTTLPQIATVVKFLKLDTRLRMCYSGRTSLAGESGSALRERSLVVTTSQTKNSPAGAISLSSRIAVSIT